MISRERRDSHALARFRYVLAPISKASESYPLTQRERITLGFLALDDAMSERELGWTSVLA